MNINSATNSSAASSNGLSGMVSGLDTDAMVESMLSPIQTRIDKQKQQQQVLTWQQEKYRDIITKINDFQDKYLSVTSNNSLRLSSSFVSSTSTASSNAVKIISSGASEETNFNVEVSQLAKAASVTSGRVSKDEIITDSSASSYSRKVTFKYGEGDDDKIEIDLATLGAIKDGEGKTDLSSFADKLNSALSGTGITVNFTAKDPSKEDSKDTLSFSGTNEFKISGSVSGLGMLGFSGTVTGKKADDSSAYNLESTTMNPDVKLNGKVTISLDGKGQEFTLQEGQTLADIQDDIKKAFGSAINIEEKDGKIKLSVNGTGRSLAISGDSEVLETIGVSGSSASSKISLSSTLAKISGASESDDKHTLEINGTTIEYTNKDTVSQIISKINNSDAGVKMSYNALGDNFTITNKSTGSDFNLSVSDSGGFMSALGFDVDGGAVKNIEQGTNAKFKIDGYEIERAGNTIEYNGVTMELKKVTTGSDPVEINTEKNVDKMYDTIKSFVDDYNTLISDLNKLTHEEAAYKEYPALTDAQKKEMTEKEIELWEEKSKTGLLRNDSDISKFLQEMRAAMYTKGSDTSLVLSNIGIDSSSNYKDYGKLVINEETLKSALKSNTSEIADLFANANTGLAKRLNDVCTRAASTSSGSPGTLVKKAGVVGKGSEKDNIIYDKLQQIATKLKTLNTLYDKKKNKYWKMFNSMETSLNNYASQSNYFASM